MPSRDLVSEADRQFTICNACRYCEGFCAVFPSAEKLTAFANGDVAYLASVCHDCRMCFDACPFTPPHEYAVNIPELLAQARVETYREYGRPSLLARLVTIPALGTSALALVSLIVVFVGVLMTRGAAILLTRHVGPGAFYRVVSFPTLLVAALILTFAGALAAAVGAWRFARDIGLFGGGLRGLGRAASDAISLVYLRGGEAGCYDARRGSSARRVLHGFVFWGFLAAFASTTAAAVEQDLVGIIPPFSLLSVPVVLGTLGGLGIAIGSAGFIVLKRRSDKEPVAGSMASLDYTFLIVLLAVALSGLLLLAFRTTAAMGTLLGLHLTTLVTLYVTAPYGKFVHFVYRYLALVRHARER